MITNFCQVITISTYKTTLHTRQIVHAVAQKADILHNMYHICHAHTHLHQLAKPYKVLVSAFISVVTHEKLHHLVSIANSYILVTCKTYKLPVHSHHQHIRLHMQGQMHLNQ